jgi:hypothetical protein
VLILMAVLPGHRQELWLSLGLAAVLATVGVVRQRRGAAPEDAAAAEPVRAASGT